jgi:hypothetical protein
MLIFSLHRQNVRVVFHPPVTFQVAISHGPKLFLLYLVRKLNYQGLPGPLSLVYSDRPVLGSIHQRRRAISGDRNKHNYGRGNTRGTPGVYWTIAYNV